jgi:hypothetical protein
VAWCLIGIAALACAHDRLDDAARLLATFDTMLTSIGAAMKPFEQRLYTRTREALPAASAVHGTPPLTETDALELARIVAASA